MEARHRSRQVGVAEPRERSQEVAVQGRRHLRGQLHPVHLPARQGGSHRATQPARRRPRTRRQAVSGAVGRYNIIYMQQNRT